MRFKHFLFEAEWVQGKRYPTIEALWHILQPLATSKDHLVALGSSDIVPAEKQKERQKRGLGIEQGTRAHPIHGGPYDPNINAVGIRVFMNHGLNAFNKHYSTYEEGHSEVLHILKVNLQDVWTLDPRFNEKNPWFVMQTHWRDLQDEYQKNITKKKIRAARFNDGNLQQVQTHWNNLVDRIQKVYRGYQDNNEIYEPGDDIAIRLTLLHKLVYIEAPRILSFLKSGYSYGSKRNSDTWFQDMSQEEMPKGYDMSFPKNWEFKIIARTLPLTDTPWAIIMDHTAAQTENTVVLPISFTGFRMAEIDPTKSNNERLSQGEPPQWAKSFYPPNSKMDRVPQMIEDFDTKFREKMVDSLEDILEKLDELELHNIEFELKWAKKSIDELSNDVRTIKKIYPDFTMPKNIADAIRDFERQAQHIMNNWNDNEDYDDEDYEDYEGNNGQLDPEDLKVAASVYQQVSDGLNSLIQLANKK